MAGRYREVLHQAAGRNQQRSHQAQAQYGLAGVEARTVGFTQRGELRRRRLHTRRYPFRFEQAGDTLGLFESQQFTCSHLDERQHPAQRGDIGRQPICQAGAAAEDHQRMDAGGVKLQPLAQSADADLVAQQRVGNGPFRTPPATGPMRISRSTRDGPGNVLVRNHEYTVGRHDYLIGSRCRRLARRFRTQDEVSEQLVM